MARATKTMIKKAAKNVQSKALIAPKALTGLQIGQKVPDFTLPATGGQEISLSALQGQKVVLFFYPKDMTPGCTIEGHEFTQLKGKFKAKNTLVFGISRDTLKSHEKFKEKEGYTVDLLSDEDETLCSVFTVMKDKNMYGKKVRGIERSTFLIDEKGRLEKEWRGVKAPGHAAEVLAALA